MVQEIYGVRLSAEEKGQLRKMIRDGGSSARAITRAPCSVQDRRGLDPFPGGGCFGRLGADGVPDKAPVHGGGIGAVYAELNNPSPEIPSRAVVIFGKEQSRSSPSLAQEYWALAQLVPAVP